MDKLAQISFVIASIALTVRPFLSAQERSSTVALIDPTSYAVYAAVLPTTWARTSHKTLVIQEQTSNLDGLIGRCLSEYPDRDPRWSGAARDLEAQSVRTRNLERRLPIRVPYRIVTRDAWVFDVKELYFRRKQWNPREAYYALSAVGFNRPRTKALVYVRTGASGRICAVELQDGKWVSAAHPTCSWIA